MAKIVVITVCKDNPADLRATLKSVSAQQVAPYEHIVFDSSATDFQPRMRSLAEEHRAQYVWQAPSGIYPAMGAALDLLADEDWVWFLNATDKMATRSAIANVGKLLSADSYTAGSGWLLGKTLVETSGHWHILTFPNSPEEAVEFLQQGLIGMPHSSSVTNVRLLRLTRAFQGSPSIAEDYRIGLSLCRVAGAPLLIPEVLSIYDRHGLSAKKGIQTLLAKSQARYAELNGPQGLKEVVRTARAARRFLVRQVARFVPSTAIARWPGWSPSECPPADQHFCNGLAPQTWPRCCNTALSI